MSGIEEHDRFNREHRRREHWAAERLLSKMNIQEAFGAKWEEREGVTDPQVEYWRHRHAETYRGIIGVHPVHREKLRTELREISKYGDVAVADAVRKIDRLPIHSKGDLSAVAAGPGNAFPPLPVVSADDNPFA